MRPHSPRSCSHRRRPSAALPGLWGLFALALAGCLTPRSAVIGQTAVPVGAGGAELALSSGLAFQSQLAPGYLTRDSTGTQDLYAQKLSRGLALPAFEANGQLGLSEQVAFNLHVSAAGIQPGAKITLNRGFAQVALLPEFAFGYGSAASSTFVNGVDGRQYEVDPSSTSHLNFLAGLKVIASHRMGLYGGLGYDIQLGSSTTTGTTGVGSALSNTESTTDSVQHNITGALGFDFAFGKLHVRPELSAVVTPGIAIRQRSGQDVSENFGGMGFLIMPTVTLAVASDPRKDEPGVEEDERNFGETEGGDEEIPPPPGEEKRKPGDGRGADERGDEGE